MVILKNNVRAERAMLSTELVVAMAILLIAVLPLGYSFVGDTRVLRATYQRAVAMEIVDGEMEILAAGEWRAFPEGAQSYVVQAGAATNLPPGRFQLTRTGNQLRLEWLPDRKHAGGNIVREVTLK
jgi:hypothetical protein